MFDKYKPLKNRNADILRDIDIAIKRLKGKTFKELSSEYKFAVSSIRRRYENIMGVIRRHSINYDEKYLKIFYIINENGVTGYSENFEEIIKVIEIFKTEISKRITNNTLYSPFLKDKVLEKHECNKCNGKGFIFK